MISVSHFDPIGGSFLDQITVTSGQVRIGPDEIVTVKVGTNRQVTKVAEPPLATAGSGEYTFAHDGEMFHPLQLGGVDVRAVFGQSLTVPQELRLAFHHGSDDVNQDVIPDAGKLHGITTRFDEGTPVQALITLTGIDPCKARVDVLDSQGQRRSTTDLPLTHAEAVTYGRLLHERLPAGVYFFEWYVNDQYLVRVPVLVFSDRQIDAASPADLATIETRLPVRVNVVVMASQASVYANQAVIDTVPQGTVLKASKIHDRWLYVERSENSGWIHEADVSAHALRSTQSPDALQRR